MINNIGRELSGQDLADYIKERQVGEARRLHAAGVRPKLVIFYDNDSPVIAKYMALKKAYGTDIGVEVTAAKFSAHNAKESILAAAADNSVHGIIVQLPLEVVSDDILTVLPPKKDVDGLNGGYSSATAEAVNWLISGNNIDLSGKRIAIVGRGKLVGEPLAKTWSDSGHNITVFHRGDDLSALKDFDVIVSATGVPGLIKSEMVGPGAVVIDAGTTSENRTLVGDVDEALRARTDIAITPRTGGVGPLTVTVLFEHLLRAAAE